MNVLTLSRIAALAPAALGLPCFPVAYLAPALANDVPEPTGLWQGHMHGDTPATLAGAEVIDAAGLARLKDRDPVIIDVAHPDGPVAQMSSERPHASIPGATWMPGAGSGSADPGFASAFEKRLADLTGGDKQRPVVAFCHPRRWGSWNAAKRAVALGYTHVYWLPAGSEGWRSTHQPAYVREDTNWRRAFDKVKDQAPSSP